MRVGQHFVDHAVPGDGGKGRSTLRAEHNDVGLLRPALIEQLLGRIAGNYDGLDGKVGLQFGRNESQQLCFYLVDGASGQDFGALLGADHMLQNQAGIVLNGQLRAKLATR